ncbi:MAG: CatB-related O-acetyltransferase [Phascolarctobacterium sp.]|nr:CatB-related O-acetyltransferase [Phascolarctobacterium sp.]
MLYEQYDISKIEYYICLCIRFVRGSNKCPKFIGKLSRKLYGPKDNLKRFWYHKFLNIVIGKYTYGYEFLGTNRIKRIGAFCSIASGSQIVSNHRMDWVSTSPILDNPLFGFCDGDIGYRYFSEEDRKIKIGNDVWIGANCIIFEGVNIGDGAVIAAGSIIRKNVAPYSVVGGVDRILKYRLPEAQIEKMLKIQWWNWKDEVIKNNIHCFYDKEKFLLKD